MNQMSPRLMSQRSQIEFDMVPPRPGFWQSVGLAVDSVLGTSLSTYQISNRVLRSELARYDPRYPFDIPIDLNPSKLVQLRGLEAYDHMRQDEQIKAALALKKHAVISAGWTIESPEDEDPEWEVTQFVEQVLTDLEGSLDTCLLDILSALDYGFSLTEKVYANIEDGEFAGKLGLAAMKTKLPHWMAFDIDLFGNIKPDGILQWAMGGTATAGSTGPTLRMPRQKFVHLAYQKEFGNPYGKSDLEAAYRAWISKDQSYRWLAMFLERFGIPTLIALVNPATMKGGNWTKLQNLLQSFQANTTGIIPRPAKDDIEMWSPKFEGQVGQVFEPALNRYDRDMAKAILMPGLLGLSSDAETGSLARAGVHFDVFLLIVDYLRQLVEEDVMNEQVIPQLVDLNYNTDRYPRFKLLPISDDIRLDIMETWTKLLAGGAVTTGGEDEGHIREVMKFPEKTEPEEPDDLPPIEDEDDLPPLEGEEGEGDDLPSGGSVGSPLAVARQMAQSKAERNADMNGIKRELLELEEMFVDRSIPVFKRARNGLIQRLRAGELTTEVIGNLKTAGLQDQWPSVVRTALQRGFRSGRRRLKEEVKAAKENAEQPNFIPADAIAWLTEQADFVVSGIDESLLTEVKNALLLGLQIGEPAAATEERIRTIYEPYIGNPNVIRDGRAVSPARLETVVRTNNTQAYNQGRLIAAREPGVEALLQGLQYSAVLDSRTTDVCRHLDGVVFKMGDPQLDRLKPPNHFNCRSVLVPVTADVDVSESTRDRTHFVTAAEAGRGVQLAGKGFV